MPTNPYEPPKGESEPPRGRTEPNILDYALGAMILLLGLVMVGMVIRGLIGTYWR